MQNIPEVSVVMSVYNSEQYLVEAVESILGQTFSNFEFIIIDDGSTDKSKYILEDYAKQDLRISLIKQANAGLTKSLNRGISLAKGRYIARMDADDIAISNRFEEQVNFLNKHPEYVAVGTRIICIDPYGLPLWEPTQKLLHSEIDAELLIGNGAAISHPTVMIRHNALVAVGGYREHLDTAQDLDLFLRLAECGNLANVSHTLLKYRIHLSSVNNTKSQRQRYNTEIILRDAYTRRGLRYPNDLKLYEWEQVEASTFYCIWAWNALKHGEVSIARKYAISAFRAKPISLNTWRLLYCSVRGR